VAPVEQVATGEVEQADEHERGVEQKRRLGRDPEVADGAGTEVVAGHHRCGEHDRGHELRGEEYESEAGQPAASGDLFPY
jgi:hypothetical protein